jgi:hypothetical protein
MKKFLLIIATFLLIISSNVSKAAIVQMDFSGYCFRTLSDSEEPAYQVGDKAVGQLIYDTDLFTAEEYTNVYSWWREFRSTSAILSYSLYITRDTEVITEMPNVFSKYPYSNMGMGIISFGSLDGRRDLLDAGAYMGASDKSSTEKVYSDYMNDIGISFAYGENRYAPTPYWPNLIVDLDYWGTPSLEITSRYFDADGINAGQISYSFDLDDVEVTVIPEPASLVLIAIGGLVLRRSRYPNF